MKVKKSNNNNERKDDEKKEVHLEETDAVIFIDTVNGKTAIHWPKIINKSTMSRIIYCLTQIFLMITEKSMEMGLHAEDIEAINLMAYDDMHAAHGRGALFHESEKELDNTKAVNFNKSFLVSGNNTVH